MSIVAVIPKLLRPILFSAIALLVMVSEVYAIGELMVTPTRIVFDERDRSAKITLINTSNAPVSYRISWSRKRMKESGGYEDATDALPGEKFSDSMIRFSPRKVVLPPGQPQVVRLLLRKPAQLDEGEYRSYIKFTANPEGLSDDIEQEIGDGSQGISIRLTPIMSVLIPVIVRQGDLSVQVGLQSPELRESVDSKAPYTLGMTMERDGNQSVYGDFLIYFDDEQGERHVVGQANGLAAYPPYSSRRVELPLYPPEGKKLEHGRLHMIYRKSATAGGETLAEAELNVP